MKKTILFSLLCLLCLGVAAQEYTEADITKAWHSGETLPVEVGLKYAPEKISPENDNGMNVLIDVSHQCGFDYIWELPRYLQKQGYRAIGSQASLDKVLDPKGMSRMRIAFDPENRIYPFAWYPNFKYNVIVTYQTDLDSPYYSEAECKELEKFVKKGGSLVILTTPQKEIPENWSMNKLTSIFEAEFLSGTESAGDRKYAGLKLSPKWKIIRDSETGVPVQARRSFGKGKVFVCGSPDDIILRKPQRTSTQEQKDELEKVNAVKEKFVAETFSWLSEGQKPFDDKYCPVRGWGGGGSIYPELEQRADGIVIYYAPNINPEQLDTVNDDFPKITEQILNWLPSSSTDEPMYLILSAGNGGGWAINAFKPKENGIITLSIKGLISIYAHEFAHTIGGPPNSKGEKAGISPIDNQGEAHAGWYQGKIDAVYDPELRAQSVKRCQNFFETDEYAKLDIKRYSEDTEYASEFGKGKDWHKLWVIWQKMDDTYGPAWYPLWRHTQFTRWADEPRRRLTWEETIEDMSIAVGEDLFPFFRALNTSLTREAMGEVEFDGEKITLPDARIDPYRAPGKVRLESIDDWTVLDKVK